MRPSSKETQPTQPSGERRETSGLAFSTSPDTATECGLVTLGWRLLISGVIPAAWLGFASRGDAPATAPVFESVRNPSHPLTDRGVSRAAHVV